MRVEGTKLSDQIIEPYRGLNGSIECSTRIMTSIISTAGWARDPVTSSNDLREYNELQLASIES